MSKFFQTLRERISAVTVPTLGFYRSHRTVLLSGVTVLSILLIVWARMGFTFQIGRFFASESITCSDDTVCWQRGGCGNNTTPFCLNPGTASSECRCASCTGNMGCSINITTEAGSSAGTTKINMSYTVDTAVASGVYGGGCSNVHDVVSQIRMPSGEEIEQRRMQHPWNSTTMSGTASAEVPNSSLPDMIIFGAAVEGTNISCMDSKLAEPSSGGGGTPTTPPPSTPTQTPSGSGCDPNETAQGSANGTPIGQRGCDDDGDGCRFGYCQADGTCDIRVSRCDDTGGGVTPTPTKTSSASPPPTAGPTPTTVGTHTASVLSVQCGATQNVLTWTLPSGNNSNSILKSIDGGNAAWLAQNISGTTYTDTAIQSGHSYRYTHKAWADVASNNVICPSPTLSPTTTASPTSTALACAPTSQTVSPGQPAVIQVSGGTGVYVWSAEENNHAVQVQMQGSSGTVIFGSIGLKTVTVSSGSQSAVCQVNVQSSQAGGNDLAVSGRNASTGGIESTIVQARSNHQVEIIARIHNSQSTALNNVVVRASLPSGLTYINGSTSVGGTLTSVDSIAYGGLSVGTLAPQQDVLVVFRALVVGSQFELGSTQVQVGVLTHADNVADRSGTLAVAVTRTSGGTGTAQTGPGDAVLVALMVSAIMTLLYVSYTHTAMYRKREIGSITKEHDPLDFRS